MTAPWMSRKVRNRDAPPRTPSLRQIQESECGVIALSIILAHNEAWVPLTDLRRRCQVSEQGVTALSLVQAAKHYGLSVRAMRLPADNLGLIQAPVILFWENAHFVVLEGIRGDSVWINDPARGHRILSLSAFRKAYSGIALIAQPGPEFQRMGRPHRPLRTAIEMLRPGRWWLSLMAAAAVAESVLLPLVVQRAGDGIRDAREGRAIGWRPSALTLTGLGITCAARPMLTRIALDTIAEPTRRRLADGLEHVSLDDGGQQPFLIAPIPNLADYPATTAVHTITAGIRMTVGIPLLVLVLGRLHPFAAPVALAALAAPVLVQQQTARAAAGTQPPNGRTQGPSGQHLGAWWPVLRPFTELSPVIVIGVLKPTDRLPAILMALGATRLAVRLVDSSVQAFGMLYMLPESIVQLKDLDQRSGVAEPTV